MAHSAGSHLRSAATIPVKTRAYRVGVGRVQSLDWKLECPKKEGKPAIPTIDIGAKASSSTDSAVDLAVSAFAFPVEAKKNWHQL